jgi:hypothetical protein
MIVAIAALLLLGLVLYAAHQVSAAPIRPLTWTNGNVSVRVTTGLTPQGMRWTQYERIEKMPRLDGPTYGDMRSICEFLGLSFPPDDMMRWADDGGPQP